MKKSWLSFVGCSLGNRIWYSRNQTSLYVDGLLVSSSGPLAYTWFDVIEIYEFMLLVVKFIFL